MGAQHGGWEHSRGKRKRLGKCGHESEKAIKHARIGETVAILSGLHQYLPLADTHLSQRERECPVGHQQPRSTRLRGSSRLVLGAQRRLPLVSCSSGSFSSAPLLALA